MMKEAKERRHGNRYTHPQMTAREANTLGGCWFKINKILQAQQKRSVYIMRTKELQEILDLLEKNALRQDRLDDFYNF